MPTSAMEDSFAKAAALVKCGSHFDAIAIYSSLAEDSRSTSDDKVRAYCNLSGCYATREQFADALTAAKKALQLDESNSKAHGRVAAAYHGLKHYEEAAEHYARAYELNPGVALYDEQRRVVLELIRSGKGIASERTRDAYYYRKGMELGKEAMAKGEYLSAVRHFTRAIDLHSICAESGSSNSGGDGSVSASSDLAVLLCNRSAARARLGHWTDSLEDAENATKVHPTYARAFFRAGYAYHQLKRPVEAHAALQKCLEHDSMHAEAKALFSEVEQLVAELKKTKEEKQREDEERVREIREQQSAERAMDSAQATATGRGRAHATSYVLCTYCNDSGHTRAECPLLRRKRPRMP
ncbi:hypothetical protein TRVL_01201 [Trypanosoma vivax]|nr:hypothetical protein TRVL_01201 [Trypanosoma vivax]